MLVGAWRIPCGHRRRPTTWPCLPSRWSCRPWMQRQRPFFPLHSFSLSVNWVDRVNLGRRIGDGVRYCYEAVTCVYSSTPLDAHVTQQEIPFFQFSRFLFFIFIFFFLNRSLIFTKSTNEFLKLSIWTEVTEGQRQNLKLGTYLHILERLEPTMQFSVEKK